MCKAKKEKKSNKKDYVLKIEISAILLWIKKTIFEMKIFYFSLIKVKLKKNYKIKYVQNDTLRRRHRRKLTLPALVYGEYIVWNHKKKNWKNLCFTATYQC